MSRGGATALVYWISAHSWSTSALASKLLARKSKVKTFRKYVHGKDIALQTPGQPPSDQQHPAAPGAH